MNNVIQKTDICAIYIILYLTKHLRIKRNFKSIWGDAKCIGCYIGNRINARLSNNYSSNETESNQYNIQSPLY